MPCINGIPQEFAMQDSYALQQKKRFPRVKILEYRITDAVPYSEIVHTKMVSDPEAFVRWTHSGKNNNSICLMPYVEHQTTGFNCSWEIRAAAYDWSQQRVQDWYLENIIKPVLKVADGAWIDGDGPDNGAWMCSGNYDYEHLPAPYPALNETEIAAFCEGETNVTRAAQRWLIENGGYDYNCFSFISGDNYLPTVSDTAEVCATKLQKLDHRPASYGSTVLYGDRTNGQSYDDNTAAQAVAVFLLTRDEYWYFGYLGENQLNATTAALLLSDYGSPLDNMTRPNPENYVFQRRYEKGTISFDCATFSAKFLPRETQQQKEIDDESNQQQPVAEQRKRQDIAS